MQELTSIERFECPSEDQIEAFENQHGIKLPASYKYYLLYHNIQYAKEKILKKNKMVFVVHTIYPFRVNNGKNSLQRVYGMLKDYFKTDYLPVANDPGGIPYVISLREKDYGNVYFCRVDEPIDQALFKISDNFEEFLDLLEVYE